jgi:hypothetical protein
MVESWGKRSSARLKGRDENSPVFVVAIRVPNKRIQQQIPDEYVKRGKPDGQLRRIRSLYEILTQGATDGF